jgi:hypothetical protein
MVAVVSVVADLFLVVYTLLLQYAVVTSCMLSGTLCAVEAGGAEENHNPPQLV